MIHRGTDPEAIKVAERFGLVFDGMLKDLYEFTVAKGPEEAKGITFVVKDLSQVEPRLHEKFKEFGIEEGNPDAKEPWQMTKVEFEREALRETFPTATFAGKSIDQLTDKEVTATADAYFVVVDETMTHKKLVQQALKVGKPVPPEVLADYPDLKPPAVEEVTIPKPTRPVTEAEKPALIGYYRKEAKKWRELADRLTRAEQTKEGEQRYAKAILKAEEFERQAKELEAAKGKAGNPVLPSIKEFPEIFTKMPSDHELSIGDKVCDKHTGSCGPVLSIINDEVTLEPTIIKRGARGEYLEVTEPPIRAQKANLEPDHIRRYAELPSDHELLLHFGVEEVASPGVVLDEARARATPCSCFTYKGRDLCWSKGIIGMLTQPQQEVYCVAGKAYKAQPALTRRYETFATAAEEAHKKIEAMPKGTERLELWLSAMGEELSKRGIEV